jgi:hypothetical protein
MVPEICSEKHRFSLLRGICPSKRQPSSAGSAVGVSEQPRDAELYYHVYTSLESMLVWALVVFSTYTFRDLLSLARRTPALRTHYYI